MNRPAHEQVAASPAGVFSFPGRRPAACCSASRCPLVGRLARAAGGGHRALDAAVNAWILIGSDNSITILVGSQEMGQGVISALPQIVAEDLMVDWAMVTGVVSPARSRPSSIPAPAPS